MSRWTTEEVRAQIHGDLDRWHGEEYETLKGLLDDLVSAARHEAAEEIRKAVRTAARDPLHYGSAAWAIAGVDEMADLIDPEAAGADG